MKLYNLLIFSALALVSCKHDNEGVRTFPIPPQNLSLLEQIDTMDATEIVCTGSMFTKGIDSFNCYPTDLGANLHAYTTADVSVYNLGDEYANLDYMTHFVAPIMEEHYNSKLRTINIAIAWELIRDMLENRTEPQTYVDRFAEYTKSLRNLGWYTIVLTVPYVNTGIKYGEYTSSGYSPHEFDSIRLIVNQELKINKDKYADMVVDVASDSAFTQYSSLYYQKDQLSLTGKAYQKVADIIYDSLKNHY